MKVKASAVARHSRVSAIESAVEASTAVQDRREPGAPLIEWSYRKERGRYLTVALSNGTSIDITAAQIARMIRASSGPPARRKKGAVGERP